MGKNIKNIQTIKTVETPTAVISNNTNNYSIDSSKYRKTEIKLAIAYTIFSFLLFLVLINSLFMYIKGIKSAINYEEDGKTVKSVDPWWYYFVFFTYQSNYAVLIYFILYIISIFCPKYKKLYSFTHNRFCISAITLYITITFLVVLALLDPIYNAEWDIVDAGVCHSFCPIAMWFLYVFCPTNSKCTYSWKKKELWIDVGYLLIYPVLYLVLVLVLHATTGCRFPYGFLDYETNGIGSFIGYFIGLLICFSLLGIGLLFLKQQIDKKIYADK